MALSALSIAALAVFHHKPPPSSFLAASVPKTVGMCSPRSLRLFRHHLRAAPAVPEPSLDRNGMAMPVIAEKNGIEQKWVLSLTSFY